MSDIPPYSVKLPLPHGVVEITHPLRLIVAERILRGDTIALVNAREGDYRVRPARHEDTPIYMARQDYEVGDTVVIPM